MSWMKRGTLFVVVGSLIGWLLASPTVAELLLLPETYVELHGETKTLQGQVIDPIPYLLKEPAGMGKEATSGSSGRPLLALLEHGTETLYLLVAEEPRADAHTSLADSVGQHVTITGRVYQRGGLRSLVVTSVKPAESHETFEPPAR